VGIATCKDAVYFVDGSTKTQGKFQKAYAGKDYLIEPGITRPIVKVSDYESQAQIDANARRFIFPYYTVAGSTQIIPEDTLAAKYPNCYQYLLATCDELATRDKGKKQYAAWYAYARTQGLDAQGSRLYTPTFAKTPRFLAESHPRALFCNGYAIFMGTDAPYELPVLQKILNSRVMDYYIHRTSTSIAGDYYCYQKNFIERFHLPILTDPEQTFLQAAKDTKKIDELLLKKYGISI
jgi:hypothetical protein